MSASEAAPIRVLLVDDQRIIAEAVRRMLATEADIDYHVCRNFDEALAFALEIAPTVILQDLMMDEHDGLDLVRVYRLQPGLADIPVVVLSANEDAQNKVEAFQAGADDYVVKLPSALELIARVRYHSRALGNARQRVAAYQQLLESRAALQARNREIDDQRQRLEQQAQALAKANLELQESAFTDPLTGLRNRRYLRQLLESRLRGWFAMPAQHRPQRHGGDDLALLLLDVDHFKQVNDRYGHDAGDRVLCEVARRLRCAVRDGDALIRWGGEEFLLVLVGIGRETVQRTVQRVLLEIGGEPMLLADGVVVRVTVSVGWALYPVLPTAPAQVSFERALYLADTAVYVAKRQGRNRAVGVCAGMGGLDESLFVAGEDAVDRLLAADGGAVQLESVTGPV